LADTNDLEFHLPNQDISLRAILVTPSCLEDANRQATLTRAEQFATVNSSGGKNSHLAIVFLLSDKAFQTARGRYRVNGLVSLQALYVLLVYNTYDDQDVDCTIESSSRHRPRICQSYQQQNQLLY
jgi:hypothetical protein